MAAMTQRKIANTFSFRIFTVLPKIVPANMKIVALSPFNVKIVTYD